MNRRIRNSISTPEVTKCLFQQVLINRFAARADPAPGSQECWYKKQILSLLQIGVRYPLANNKTIGPASSVTVESTEGYLTYVIYNGKK